MSTRHRHVHEQYFESSRDRIKPPSHRHAAPSAPWPWVDIEDSIDKKKLANDKAGIPEPCNHRICHRCWKRYPQSLFPNWTPEQVTKSGIGPASEVLSNAKIYYVDVDVHGRFDGRDFVHPNDPTKEQNYLQVFKEDDIDRSWRFILNDGTHMKSKRGEDIRVRALFLEHMSGPVMQMLGTRYNIEPFFFSSSLNWIPSRYEEEVQPGVGDREFLIINSSSMHTRSQAKRLVRPTDITITLTFLHSVSRGMAKNMSSEFQDSNRSSLTLVSGKRGDESHGHPMIDTQAPLNLGSEKQLVLDLMSVHFIRKEHGSTIISYHPSLALPTTTAEYLHKRIRFAGQSVYWQTIFRQSKDPTFILLTFIWHALYSWDEALENLYSHICNMESQVINTTELQMNLTKELHVIRAHHLHYSSLLEDFKKTVVFIRDTKNPAMQNVQPEEKEFSRQIMNRECANLLSEIERLENSRRMQDKRLKNVMNLVFSTVNIEDSKRMHKMTEAAVKDSAGMFYLMKQIAYLTMFFLPASFVAAVFGMNVDEIAPDTNGTLPHYVETALPLTITTVWIIIAFQSQDIYPKRVPYWKRFGWPFVILLKLFGWDIYKADIQRENEEAAMGILGVEHHRLAPSVPKKKKSAPPKQKEVVEEKGPQVIVETPSGLPVLMLDPSSLNDNAMTL